MLLKLPIAQLLKFPIEGGIYNILSLKAYSFLSMEGYINMAQDLKNVPETQCTVQLKVQHI